MKTHLDLPRDEGVTSPLYLYGGSLDLMHGKCISDDTARLLISDLTFASLFYKYIIVPDAFFHCYGPLHDILRFQYGPRSAAKAELRELVEGLLKEGILVPAIRQGDSLFNNWKKHTAGILPGGGTCLTLPSTDENIMYLQFLTEKYATYCAFPPARADFGRSRFFDAVQKHIFSEDNINSMLNAIDREYRFTRNREVVSQAKDVIVEFGDRCKMYRSGFRRGVVETIISEIAGISASSNDKYHQIERRVSYVNPRLAIRYNICKSVLATCNTIYQVLHSLEMYTVGGLFADHSDWLIDAGIYGEQVNLTDRTPTEQFRSIDEFLRSSDKIHLRLGMLTLGDIRRLRKDSICKNGEKLFDRYCYLKVQSSNESASLSHLVQYLYEEYLPQINKLATESKSERTKEYLLETGIKLHYSWPGILLQLGGKAISFFLSKAVAVAEPLLVAKDYVSTLAEARQNKKSLIRFETSEHNESKIECSQKNNYTV